MDPTLIVLAGGTGQLGRLIAAALIARGASVRAIVRPSAGGPSLDALRATGAAIVPVEPAEVAGLAEACSGAACVVSALNGLRDVVVDAQTALLEAAVKAGVPRFIPSDFSADFTQVPEGQNRNFDLRREFKARLDRAPIEATSILNGGFMDMLADQMPLILPKVGRLLYWGDADQPLDFTTMRDTAAYTAEAALDPTTPRLLKIAGEVVSARDLARIAGEAKGGKFRLLRLGSTATLATMIRVARTLYPQRGAVFPAWQGMQYLHNMFSGRAKLAPLDNDRYPGLRWTKVRHVLAGT